MNATTQRATTYNSKATMYTLNYLTYAGFHQFPLTFTSRHFLRVLPTVLAWDVSEEKNGATQV